MLLLEYNKKYKAGERGGKSQANKQKIKVDKIKIKICGKNSS